MYKQRKREKRNYKWGDGKCEGLELSAPSKMQGWKMQDWKYRHHVTRGGKCWTGIIGTKLQWWKMQEQAVIESQNTCGTGSVARRPTSYLLQLTQNIYLIICQTLQSSISFYISCVYVCLMFY